MNRDYNGPERRTPAEPTSVSLDALTNGARKLIVRFIWSLFFVGVTAGGWLARQEITNTRQDEDIARQRVADSVINSALGEAVKELNATIRGVVDDQQKLQQEMQLNREGIGILDAESESIRRDFEREHGRRP